ncbi:MAG: hypothetical protein QF595_11765 [Dehalococcoidia bacterium]|nr:hypothetical protein [Dehalococcoidia bacterium]
MLPPGASHLELSSPHQSHDAAYGVFPHPPLDGIIDLEGTAWRGRIVSFTAQSPTAGPVSRPQGNPRLENGVVVEGIPEQRVTEKVFVWPIEGILAHAPGLR